MLTRLVRIEVLSKLLLLPLMETQRCRELKAELGTTWTQCWTNAIDDLQWKIGHDRKTAKGPKIYQAEDPNDGTTPEDVLVRAKAGELFLMVVNYVERFCEGEIG